MRDQVGCNDSDRPYFPGIFLPQRALTVLIGIVLSLAVAISAETPRSGPSVDLSHGKLKVSDNHRFLVHSDGTPFFYMACTGWELFERLTREDADQYLENRRAKGFTVIQAVAVGELEGRSGQNAYGQSVFVNGDVSQPNEQYFAHVDYIVNKAAEKGIVIGMLPTWATFIGDFNSTTAYNYGYYLGNRYGSKTIIWILGGDRNPDAPTQDVWRSMARGIANGVSGSENYDSVLMTFHPTGGSTSSSWFQNESWFDFSMWQNGHCRDVDVWNRIQQTYNLSPTKPTMDGEPLYEEHPICFNAAQNGTSDEVDMRKFAYGGIFAGAHGHTYGCHAIWQMYAPGRNAINGPKRYWYESIDLPGAWDMMHVRNLIESRPFLSRVPDQDIIASDAFSGGDRIQATRGDGYAFVYSASGRGFTVNMGRIPGTEVRAWWYNPREGTAAEIGTYSNTGTRAFTPPSNGYGNDWVLVLDDSSAGFSAPGAGGGTVSPTLYVLTVTNGSGSGSYAMNAQVTITASSAPSGQVFDKWVVNSGNPSIGSTMAATTTLIMPSSAVAITATYKVGTPSQSSETVYEAESGTAGGGAQIQSASNASNGSVIGGVNNNGAQVSIGSVNGGSGGIATMMVTYSNGYASDRSLSLYINGSDVYQIAVPPTGGWNTFATTSPISIILNAGTDNTIKVQKDADDENAFDIDKITVKISDGQTALAYHGAAKNEQKIAQTRFAHLFSLDNGTTVKSLEVYDLTGRRLLHMDNVIGNATLNSTARFGRAGLVLRGIDSHNRAHSRLFVER